MELNISEGIIKSKSKDIDQFIDELRKTLESPEISKTSKKNQKQNTIFYKNIEEEPRDSFGLTQSDYRRAIDEENFAPTIAKEFGFSEEDMEILRRKIDNYLKEYSKYCGIISYQGYDMNKNQYYDDWYENGKKHRNKLTEQEFAQGYNMGWFYRLTPYPKDSRNFNGTLFEEVKEAIKSSIQEQLEKGISVKNINLLKLESDIKNNEYLKPLYDNFN